MSENNKWERNRQRVQFKKKNPKKKRKLSILAKTFMIQPKKKKNKYIGSILRNENNINKNETPTNPIIL